MSVFSREEVTLRVTEPLLERLVERLRCFHAGGDGGRLPGQMLPGVEAGLRGGRLSGDEVVRDVVGDREKGCRVGAGKETFQRQHVAGGLEPSACLDGFGVDWAIGRNGDDHP